MIEDITQIIRCTNKCIHLYKNKTLKFKIELMQNIKNLEFFHL